MRRIINRGGIVACVAGLVFAGYTGISGLSLPRKYPPAFDRYELLSKERKQVLDQLSKPISLEELASKSDKGIQRLRKREEVLTAQANAYTSAMREINLEKLEQDDWDAYGLSYHIKVAGGTGVSLLGLAASKLASRKRYL